MPNKPDFTKYDQYKKDIFTKLDFPFEKGKKLLDVGCGDGSDARILIQEYRLEVVGIDVYRHPGVNDIDKLIFKKAGIFDIPFPDNSFDYVFMHDVLHHIDEGSQRIERHLSGLQEVKRVVKNGGYVVIVEGNRYNPLFYPHMVKMLGHEHFSQKYFMELTSRISNNVEYRFFEAHKYPYLLGFFKLYEKFMENYSPKMFLAYNVAIIKL
jgi:ubiquinone/menaquinone biosynthesis C-methylase UbiE